MPDNLAALYTLQSRRVMLVRSEGFVTAYRICGGDFFTSENAFLEPMTIWRVDREASKGGNEVCKPKAHNYAAQMWREFPSASISVTEIIPRESLDGSTI